MEEDGRGWKRVEETCIENSEQYLRKFIVQRLSNARDEVCGRDVRMMERVTRRKVDRGESWEEKSVFGGEPRRLEESQPVAEASKRIFVFFCV